MQIPKILVSIKVFKIKIESQLNIFLALHTICVFLHHYLNLQAAKDIFM